MSGSQGNYDLALSRADHDMWFAIVQKAKPIGSIWDSGYSLWDTDNSKWDQFYSETIWDNGDCVWDCKWDPTQPPLGTAARYAIVAINGADKVAQQIKITLLAFLGEWFLDVTFGVPYLEDILVKTPHMAAIETILRSHITDVPHVLRFESFSMDFDRARRTLGVNFVVITDYGPITDSFKLDVTAHV
jgi:hypothetical protein